MADKQTIELTAMEQFRMLLEKHSIEYETNDDECAEGEERTTVFEANLEDGFFATVAVKDWYCGGELTPWLNVEFHEALTPEQVIAATLGNKREKALELLVKQLWYLVNNRSGYGYAAALEAIEELGIEMD